jgi:CheY-like chemotaxis protein
LGQWGYRVRTAGSLGQALEAVAREEFDLLVSDIELGDGSGLDLMRAVRSGRPVPGITLSGFGSDEDVAQSLAAGFAAHLTKPVDLRRLITAIGEVIRAESLVGDLP